MNARRLRIAVLAIVVLAAAGAILAWANRRPAPPAGPLQAVVIATNTDYIGACPVLAAQSQGYFAANGIAATVQAHSSGKAALDSLLSQHADFATVADIPIMFAAMQDVPIAVAATLYRGRDHGIVARHDRGVDRPVDLKGKRIGVTLRTSAHFALDAFLNRQGLAPHEVTLSNYAPEQLPAALARGEIDAAADWEPFLAAMAGTLGPNAASFNAEDVYEINFNLAAMRDRLRTDQPLVRRLLRALIAGEQFCATSPDAALPLLPAGVRDQAAKLRPTWSELRFGLTLDQSLILAMEDEARWAIRNGMTPRGSIPNFLDHISLDGLEAVQPQAVTVIH